MDGRRWRRVVCRQSARAAVASLACLFALPAGTAVAAPSNDLFATPTMLPSQVDVAASGSNIGATVEPGEGSHVAYRDPQQSVWYQWTAPIDGSLTITTTANFYTA